MCGIYDKCVQRRFLQETTLTYDGALKITLTAESAAKDSKRLQKQSPDADMRQHEPTIDDKSVHRVGNRPTKKFVKPKHSPPQQSSTYVQNPRRCPKSIASMHAQMHPRNIIHARVLISYSRSRPAPFRRWAWSRV